MFVGLIWLKPREIPDADDDDWRSLFRGLTLSAHDSVVVVSGWLQSTELLCSLLLAIGCISSSWCIAQLTGMPGWRILLSHGFGNLVDPAVILLQRSRHRVSILCLVDLVQYLVWDGTNLNNNFSGERAFFCKHYKNDRCLLANPPNSDVSNTTPPASRDTRILGRTAAI